MGQCCEAISPPTQAAKKYVIVLYIFTIIQLLISISNFICASQYLVQGILGLLLMLFLLIAARRLSYMLLTLMVFFSIFFAIRFMVAIFTPVQHQDNFSMYQLGQMYCWVIAIISCTYYLVVAIFLFFPYKEFKSIQFNQNPAIRAYFDMMNQENQQIRNQQMQNVVPYDENQNRQQNYYADYGQYQPNPPPKKQQKVQEKKKQNQSTYQVFKGKGIRIG